MEHVRNQLRLVHVPIIAVTGIATHEALMRTLESGFAGHLVKPVSRQSIQAEIARALGK